MLDRDLANLYDIEIKVFNQAVKRNSKRFPSDFLFQLSKDEYENFSNSNAENKLPNPLRSQFVTLKTGRGQHRKYLPYAFTEQGVAMLSGVLNSERAIQMNIAIMRAFVEIRKILIRETDLKIQLQQIKDRIGEHDVQLNQIYDAIENLLDEKASQRNWDNRERIGFK